MSTQSLLESPIASGAVVSSGLWRQTVETLGGRISAHPGEDVDAQVSIQPILTLLILLSVLAWIGGSALVARRRKLPLLRAAAAWGTFGWIWWLIGGSWELARLAAYVTGIGAVESFVLATPAFWISLGAAGWVATFLSLLAVDVVDARAIQQVDEASAPHLSGRSLRVPIIVWIAGGVYVFAFVTMNWQLYRGLLLPHGDSAMYEEHLWNLLHGKGFRSYLDQGLFLGEHIQVIHLLLIPLYVLWPSQMMLELCNSVLLAAGCIPVYWIARRHTADSRTAASLAVCYLLSFPLQFLDIGFEGKTFRPNGLAIPVLLFAIDQLERRRPISFAFMAAVALSAQEDYAIVLAPLGIWIALRYGNDLPSPESKTPFPSRAAGFWQSRFHSRAFWWGWALTVLSAIYLLVATRLVMAWFRNWQEIHYAGYFSRFGKTLPEIAWTMITRPALLWETFVTPTSAIYALMLLAPVGLLSLFSPGRLAIAFPLFVTLCLNETITHGPRHHAHAAVLPFVFWSAAAGLATAAEWTLRWFHARGAAIVPTQEFSGGQAASCRWWGRFACASALFTGIFFGISPVSMAFWDPYSEFFWRSLYVPGKRAEMFARVLPFIPPTARVASTDFIHPRFTHFARSYDYSDYRRAVSNYEAKVPDDTDYIVIDTHHEYSKIHSPDQVRELREHPEQWELLPDNTEGYFIVLKRRHKPPPSERASSATSAPAR